MGPLCACDVQYAAMMVGYECVAASTYCSFKVPTTVHSCRDWCQANGGDCIDVYDNTVDFSCTEDSTDPRNCTDKGETSVVCKCSRGCGTGPSCVAPFKCVAGHCQQ